MDKTVLKIINSVFRRLSMYIQRRKGKCGRRNWIEFLVTTAGHVCSLRIEVTSSRCGGILCYIEETVLNSLQWVALRANTSRNAIQGLGRSRILLNCLSSRKMDTIFGCKGTRAGKCGLDFRGQCRALVNTVNKQTNKLRGLSLRANYINRATASCRRR
jgi:hypothetical protein